jgi:hypothetical protein
MKELMSAASRAARKAAWETESTRAASMADCWAALKAC